jgi:hypothetical protein
LLLLQVLGLLLSLLLVWTSLLLLLLLLLLTGFVGLLGEPALLAAPCTTCCVLHSQVQLPTAAGSRSALTAASSVVNTMNLLSQEPCRINLSRVANSARLGCTPAAKHIEVLGTCRRCRRAAGSKARRKTSHVSNLSCSSVRQVQHVTRPRCSSAANQHIVWLPASSTGP